LDIDADQIEYKEIESGDKKFMGFIKKGTNIPNGLGRKVRNNG